MKVTHKFRHECKQCGKCCIVYTPNGWESCKWLIKYLPVHKMPRTRCAIYKHRLYAIVGDKQYCGWRINQGFNFPDCPFNKPNLETHPKYINRE